MKILVVDIETTNFLLDGGKIVEVGIVELDLRNGDKRIIFNQVTHETGITREEVESSWIVDNSSLTVEDVRMSVNLKNLIPKIQKIINSYEAGVTAFNKEFDFSFLRSRGVEIKNELPCLMKLSTGLCRLPGLYGDYKWPTVEEAYAFFFPGRVYAEKHRGADDALHEADIAYELFKRNLLII